MKITAKNINAINKWLDEDDSRSVDIEMCRGRDKYRNRIWFYDYKLSSGKHVYLDEPFQLPDLLEVKRESDMQKLEELQKKYKEAK